MGICNVDKLQMAQQKKSEKEHYVCKIPHSVEKLHRKTKDI